MIQIKRIYEDAREDDGHRILVDRLWPRGISKDAAKIDLWLKEISPSTSLRKWFDHDPDKWIAFKTKFALELQSHTIVLKKIKDLENTYGTVTLVYAASNSSYNNAVAILDYLQKQFS